MAIPADHSKTAFPNTECRFYIFAFEIDALTNIGSGLKEKRRLNPQQIDRKSNQLENASRANTISARNLRAARSNYQSRR